MYISDRLNQYLTPSLETGTRDAVSGPCFLQEEILKMPPRSDRGGIQPAGSHIPASLLAARTSLSQDEATGTMTSHSVSGQSLAPGALIYKAPK